MEFSRMKRRELLALCAEHGLAARGSKADLAASIAGALSVSASAAAAEKVVEVMAGKGCLKRSGDGPSGGNSGAMFNKVTFSFVEMEEDGEILIAGKVSRRGHQQKRVETSSAAEGVAEEVCANAQVIGSRTNAVNLCTENRVERHDDLAEQEREVAAATVDRKRRTHENPKRIAASAQAADSGRSTRRSISFTTTDGSARSQNAPAEKAGEVIGGAGHTKLKRKMTGTVKVGDMLPATVVSNSSVEVVAGEVGADAQETRAKRNADNLCADSGDANLNILAETEEDGDVVHNAADSTWKQKTLENAEEIAVAAKACVISHRNLRSSSLPADDVLLCPIAKKKTGGRAAELGIDNKASEVKDFPAASSSIIIESNISQSEEECYKLAMQKSAKVAVSRRVTRSCSVNAAATMTVAIENKGKMKTETVHPDRVVPAGLELDVYRNDAPVIKSLRNRDLQSNNTMLEETHIGKMQSRRSANGRHQQLSSCSEEQEQVAAPCKSPPLLENARSEDIQNSKCEGVGKRPPVRQSTRNRVVGGQS